MKDSENYDIYRDSLWRYLGYSNEVGEAFRPLIHKHIVNLSYGVAISYVMADVYDKTSRTYKRTESSKQATITAGDVFLWQMLASVIIPGFTINRITWAASRLIRQVEVKNIVKKVFPTAVGLSSIPFIIRPIDSLVDYLMEKTYREIMHK